MAIIRVRDENGEILEIPAFAGPVGGHYKPVVEQTGSDTVKMFFVASRDDMDAIDPVEITLPVTDSSLNAAATEIIDVAYEAYEGNLLLPSGKTKSSAGKVTSNTIPANVGEVYLLTCSANWANPLYVVYDSSGAVIDSVVSAATEEGTVWTEESVTMPEGTSYFRIGCNMAIQPDGHSVKQVFTTTSGTSASTKKWSGKKWVVIGDSLTEKNIRTTRNYHDYIAEATGITVVNLGVGGTGYLNGKADGTAFYQRIAENSEEIASADIITVFGSGNDRDLTLGEIGAETVTDPSNIGEAFIATINTIYDVAPTVRLGVITPTPWMDHKPGNGTSTMTIYSDAIADWCNTIGVPCLNLYRCSGLRPWDETFRTLAYSKDDGDGTHPDETGHAIIAPKIKAFLETLLM